MLELLNGPLCPLATILAAGLDGLLPYLLILVGFSLVIFVHELGHFLVAKLCGVRVEKFALGFGKELLGFTRGETRYAVNALPLGGYVKMLGQEDFTVDKSGEWRVRHDPRSFTHKPVGVRMLIVSAGVTMNLLFAALLFIVVFMIGFKTMAPVVGTVYPDGPAARGGLQSGDRIVRIDGEQVHEFADIKAAIMLAEPHEPLPIEVLRDGRLVRCTVVPEPNPQERLLQIGITPAFTLKVAAVMNNRDRGQDRIQVGDVILEAGGKKAESFLDVLWQIVNGEGDEVPLVVARKDPDNPNAPARRVTVHARAGFSILPAEWNNENTRHLLGLVPRRKVVAVERGSRAELAGLQVGDVIVRWDRIEHPTYEQIIESIRKSYYDDAEHDIRVVVLRGERTERLIVCPKAERGRFGLGEPKPKVGASFVGLETAHLIIADVIREVGGVPTPAASLHLRPGARILAVNGQPVATWVDLKKAFFANAGQTVQITYQHGSTPPVTETMPVPASLKHGACRDEQGNVVHMPAACRIMSIAGQETAQVIGSDGVPREMSVGFWRAARQILKENIGRTVAVRYLDLAAHREHTVQMAVTAENVDPWAMRIAYDVAQDGFVPEYLETVLKTRNPLRATWWGVRKVVQFVTQNYVTMKRMIFTRTVGVEQISGPVGIVKIGSEAAHGGIVTLMYFLAFISVALAVINFLPMPIVDGGLMVFLLIEKIKGTPISIKTQAVTQLIGLVLIIAAVVFVTLMDIKKWIG